MISYLTSFVLLNWATCGTVSSSDLRIIGGQVAPVGAFPYMAFIRNQYYTHYCGASIISSTSLLTAAHCLEDQSPSYITAVVGTNIYDKGGQSYNCSEFRIHDKHDIAIIKLKETIIFSDLVATVDLETEDVGGNVNCVASGWGKTKSGETKQLQYINLTTLTNHECGNNHVFNVSDFDICTFTKAGEGMCFGDSGSPLVANNKEIGIVSRGIPCAVGYPDVYTRVSYFKDWIKENI